MVVFVVLILAALLVILELFAIIMVVLMISAVRLIFVILIKQLKMEIIKVVKWLLVKSSWKRVLIAIGMVLLAGGNSDIKHFIGGLLVWEMFIMVISVETVGFVMKVIAFVRTEKFVIVRDVIVILWGCWSYM